MLIRVLSTIYYVMGDLPIPRPLPSGSAGRFSCVDGVHTLDT